MRVQIVDPSGYSTPYDHALCGALARAGLDVELLTSRFLHGPAPAVDGYRLSEAFYRRASGRGAAAGRRRQALKLAEHVPDMLRYRRHAREADVRHFQWLPLEALDSLLLPPNRPRVLTLHNVLRRSGQRGQTRAMRRLARSMDALIVHSRDSARRLAAELGGGERVHVIHHGAFDYLTRLPEERPLAPELAAVDGPVVLCFGMVRPYKGVDVLLDAFREIEGAELWVVGRPLGMSLEPLRELAARVPATVRFVSRYITDPEIPAFFRRADVVALPYREIDQSGVLYCALAFGKPLVLSAVGGFAEVGADHAAARLVPPGDSGALTTALRELLASHEQRERLGAAALRAARGPYSWDAIGRRTAALYEELVG